MNTNDDRNLIIVKYVRATELLKIEPTLRTAEQLEELVELEKDIENLKVKISKQPTENMFTDNVTPTVVADPTLSGSFNDKYVKREKRYRG